jgi:uncharacterized membrane protein
LTDADHPTLDMIHKAVEFASLSIELMAVAIILVAVVYGLIRFAIDSAKNDPTAYQDLKRRIGRSLLLGLEFLVAADIIRTVALDPSLQSVLVLGLLVLVRTFLSWALIVEIDGRWPWQGADNNAG